MAIEMSKAVQNNVRELVVDNWRDMKDERGVLEQTWKRCLMAFLCKFDKGWAAYAKQANRSCRYVALTWDAVQTISPQMINAAMGVEDWLQISPERVGFDETDDQWAEAMKHLLKYQMRHGKFEKTAKTAARSLIILGNCPKSVAWVERRAVNYGPMMDEMNKWVEDTVAYNAQYEQITQEHEALSFQSRALGGQPLPKPDFAPPPRPPVDSSIVFQGPVMRIGSIFNYVQEQHPNDDDSSIRIIRSWRTKAYLKKMAKPKADGYVLYNNLSQIEDMESEDRAEDNDAEALLKSAIGMQLPHSKDKVQLKEMHGTFEINGRLYENYIATVANDNTLIRCEPSPLLSGRPLVSNARLNVMEGAVYGMGPIEKALDEQDSANAVHNQAIDAVNVIIQPEFEVLEDSLVNAEMAPSGPGVRHFTTEMGSIQAIPKNFQGVGVGMEVVERIIGRHERITGAINTAPQKDETATRTARNTNIISTKLGDHVWWFEEEFLADGLNTFLEMNAQYLEADQIIKVTQDKRVQNIEIPVEAIKRGWLVHTAGSKKMAEKDQRIQDLMMAIQLAEQREIQGIPSPLRIDILWRQLMIEILGETGEVVKPKEEYQQEMAQYEQMKARIAATEATNGQAGQGQAGGGQGAGAPGAGAGLPQ